MKRMNFLKVAVLFAVLLSTSFILQSCQSKKVEAADLAGYWVLKSLDGIQGKESFKGALPTIEFNFENNTISGTGGCNRYSGGFTLVDNKFAAPNLASTDMLCFEENKEHDFLQALAKSSDISLEGNILKFTLNGVVILEFEKGELAKAASFDSSKLAGLWTLKSLAGGGISALFPETKPTIEFNLAENRLYGKGGCNNYNASFALATDTLMVKPIMSTMMACPQLEGEGIYTKALADTSTIAIVGDVLQVSKNGALLLEFEKSQESKIK